MNRNKLVYFLEMQIKIKFEKKSPFLFLLVQSPYKI